MCSGIFVIKSQHTHIFSGKLCISLLSYKQSKVRNTQFFMFLYAWFLCSSEASKYLLEVLESVNATELDDIIEKVLDAVEKQPCKYRTTCLTKSPFVLEPYNMCICCLTCTSRVEH